MTTVVYRKGEGGEEEEVEGKRARGEDEPANLNTEAGKWWWSMGDGGVVVVYG